MTGPLVALTVIKKSVLTRGRKAPGKMSEFGFIHLFYVSLCLCVCVCMRVCFVVVKLWCGMSGL